MVKIERQTARTILTVLNRYAGNYEQYDDPHDYFNRGSAADRAYVETKLKALFNHMPLFQRISEEHICQMVEAEQFELELERMENRMIKEALSDVLGTMTPREEKLLRLRYGLQDGHMHSLQEIANEFNVSREFARYLEEKALRKLRHPNRTKPLKGFI